MRATMLSFNPFISLWQKKKLSPLCIWGNWGLREVKLRMVTELAGGKSRIQTQDYVASAAMPLSPKRSMIHQ